jgi:hypothetical protein
MVGQPNNPLKPTVVRVTPFAEKAKPTPRYGGLVPPLYYTKKKNQNGYQNQKLG